MIAGPRRQGTGTGDREGVVGGVGRPGVVVGADAMRIVDGEGEEGEGGDP